MSDHSEDDTETQKPSVAKTAVDLQRIKLMKLMKNPEKPVLIPERPKQKNIPGVPEFVRNVMGSSAGAGSGEFHVYRHLRRKEYARQKYIQEKGQKELLDEEYRQKRENAKKMAKEATAKRRAKRLKKKQKFKEKKLKLGKNSNKQKQLTDQTDSSSETSDEEKSNDCENAEKITKNSEISEISSSEGTVSINKVIVNESDLEQKKNEEEKSLDAKKI